jgi:anti-sigma factor RsiW
VTHRQIDGHLSAETVQALLEGELSQEERARVEEHVHLCPGCAAELEAWESLFAALGELPVLRPGDGFADRVIQVLHPAEPRSLAARARAALDTVWSTVDAKHPAHGTVHDLVEGLLPVRVAARVGAHVESCGSCAEEAALWGSVLERLRAVGHLTPSEGFATRVMAQVRVPAPAKAPRTVPDWRRALSWVGGLLPQTRQAWATLSGIAVAPAATLGLLLWTLFTHPTLTPGALASFAWWKASDLAVVLWQAMASTAMESAGLFGVFSILGSVTLSPVALVGTFLLLSVGTVAASWILYRNLFAAHPVDGYHAHVSHS